MVGKLTSLPILLTYKYTNMSVYISPAGLAAAPGANQLAIVATYKERLCKSYCVGSTLQPQISATYSNGTPRFVGETVFIPIRVVITVVTQTSCCHANTQLFTENYVVAFRGQTGLPTSVTISAPDRDVLPSCVQCGRANGITINDSLLITITPPAA